VTTYGADAITGVVNFITARTSRALKVSASEQITELGDGNFMRVDLTVGANLMTVRGKRCAEPGLQES
jgi:outer membrane cobalamin receptor